MPDSVPPPDFEADAPDSREVTTNALGDALVATFERDPDADYLRRAAIRIMDRLVAGNCRGLLIDLSPVELLDPFDFEGVRRIVDMAGVMGARSVLVGLRPEIVATLVDFGVDTGRLVGALTLAHGLELLRGGGRPGAPVPGNVPGRKPVGTGQRPAARRRMAP